MTGDGDHAPAIERRAGPAPVPAVVTLRADDGALALIHRHGAHVTSWRPAADGDERLYLSGRSAFEGDAAIRGGVPVIFPQFAAEGPLPRHGFARTSLWSLGGVARAADGTAEAELVLRDSEATRAIWDARFRAVLAVSVAGDRLAIALSVENTGDAPFSFTAALHTYFRVRDVADVTIVGLRGTPYRVTGDSTLARDEADVLRVPGFIDRVYVDAPPHLELREPGRAVHLDADGFRDAVVWNPGPDGAAKLKDLDPGGERHFVCVEAGVIQEPVTIGPRRRWAGAQRMTVANG
ncbi:MAG TPA: D-hexose-6-phosphate mutarotase [Gemmatimonadaceae bacterium]|jgi:glucose-6-phosphate 1-epimerase|nr:D-hexose-6-phosphate mutarotase [Gemmatimonadaceae bacterium]